MTNLYSQPAQGRAKAGTVVVATRQRTEAIRFQGIAERENPFMPEGDYQISMILKGTDGMLSSVPTKVEGLHQRIDDSSNHLSTPAVGVLRSGVGLHPVGGFVGSGSRIETHGDSIRC